MNKLYVCAMLIGIIVMAVGIYIQLFYPHKIRNYGYWNNILLWENYETVYGYAWGEWVTAVGILIIYCSTLFYLVLR